MPQPVILYQKTASHVARITLNHPAVGNAIDAQMAQELADACRQADGDGGVYAVVIDGAGDVFCTGGETGAYASGAVGAMGKPVIAVLNGDALGQGLEIALACDIRIAASTARFGFPQVGAGTIPLDGGTQRLPRLIGKGKALEMVLLAQTVTAAEALEMGLVSKVVPPEALAAEADTLSQAMAAKAPIALRYIKEAVNQGLDMTLEQGLRLEADLYFLLHTTADRTEGIRAFQQKRKPDFKGQ